MWELAALALLGGSRLLVGIRRAHARRGIWEAAAAACGLADVRIEGSSVLRGRVGPLHVALENYAGRLSCLRIGVTGPESRRLREVTIRPESRVGWEPDIEIGDQLFDSAFDLHGPQRLLRSLLDAETRRLLFTLNAESRLEIAGGTLRAVAPHERVSYLLPLLLDVGKRFVQALDDPCRLAEIARKDPVKEVRLRTLQLLIRELPGDPMTADAIRDACADPSPEIRLRAALQLGDAGRALLRELAESTADDESTAQAIRALDGDLPQERAEAILRDALRKRLFQAARACLERLGASGNPAAVDSLTIVMDREGNELAAAAALALGATGNANAEPALLRALERTSLELRVAAATALSRVGSAAAVLPLKEAAHRDPSTQELRKAARQAVAEIQSRLQGASPGQLSLASGEAGRLSLAESDAGQLSLASDPGGQLALGGEEEGPA